MPLLNRTRGDVAPNDDRYLSLRELTKYAGVSIRTLRKYISRDMKPSPLPHFKVGTGIVLVKQSEFDAWMQQFKSRDDDAFSDTVDELMEELR